MGYIDTEQAVMLIETAKDKGSPWWIAIIVAVITIIPAILTIYIKGGKRIRKE